MMRYGFIGTMVCMALIFGSAGASAADLGPGRWWQQPGMSDELKLTEKEKASLDDLFNKNRNRLIDMRGAVEKERLKLEDILGRDKLDEAAARDQFKRMEKIRYGISSERFNFILGVRKTLGADRFRILTGKFEEMRKKRYGRHGQCAMGQDEK